MLFTNTIFYLPRTMDAWPWPRAINPHYHAVMAESDAWMRSFNAFNPQSQAGFDRGDFGRLAALTCPKASREVLRVACDLTNLLYLVDDYTEAEGGEEVRHMVDVLLDALNNPGKTRPAGEILLGQVMKEFWSSAVRLSSVNSQKHLVASLTDHFEAIVVQAQDRDTDHIRGIDPYLENRRENSAIRPTFFPALMTLDLPDDVYCHPILRELEYCVADLVLLGNDIYSYNKERTSGKDLSNILTVVMHELRLDLSGALRWVAKYHKEVEAKFFATRARMPSFGPAIDVQLGEYIDFLGNWPRGNDCYHFECARYFGSRGREIQETRWVPLLPRKCADSSRTKYHVVVPIIEL